MPTWTEVPFETKYPTSLKVHPDERSAIGSSVSVDIQARWTFRRGISSRDRHVTSGTLQHRAAVVSKGQLRAYRNCLSMAAFFSGCVSYVNLTKMSHHYHKEGRNATCLSLQTWRSAPAFRVVALTHLCNVSVFNALQKKGPRTVIF